MNRPKFDPDYVQISIREAAEVLGVSLQQLDELRRTDENFPDGFKGQHNWLDPIKFRLADVYQYSKYLMAESKPVKGADPPS
ncbi:hypothetical protein CK501_06065 [Halovibrio salipaludis]|uniref:DNA-binding protein n=1 Tax=Halovibrio salipaludis TaxID=2032626 RepID=A0A2A2F995_9GAMM|nr:hypothetical protein [Halovibrio salipaludis]PAU81123.1 hypothetical protein CK501_06065 [Halovibrio salipaludis]